MRVLEVDGEVAALSEGTPALRTLEWSLARVGQPVLSQVLLQREGLVTAQEVAPEFLLTTIVD